MSLSVRSFSSSDLDRLYVDWKMSGALVLPDKPRIAVAGAFEGRLMRLLAEMYPQHDLIIGFEPQRWAAENCGRNTAQYANTVVVPMGLLADKRVRETISLGEYGTDACSALGAPREQGDGIFSDAYTLLDEWAPFDLFVMNMEGFEYRLLEYLANKGPTYIRQFAVQFHEKYELSPYHTIELSRYMKERYGNPLYDDYPRWVYWRGPYA